jgi:hypothetical protein
LWREYFLALLLLLLLCFRRERRERDFGLSCGERLVLWVRNLLLRIVGAVPDLCY